MQNTYICLILGIILLFKGLNGTICYQSQSSDKFQPSADDHKVEVECPPNTIGCLKVKTYLTDGTFFTERQEDIRKGFLTKMLKCFIDWMIEKAMYNL